MSFVLQTSRLELRTWSRDDLALAQELWGDPTVMSYIDVRGGLTPKQVEAKLEAEIDCLSKHGIQYWPMFERATGEFVGVSGLKPWVHSDREGPEMGFHLRPSHWGKGIASEIGRGVIDHAFGPLGLKRIMAGHHPGNLGSRKVLLGLGFEFVEHVHFKPTGLMHLSYELVR